MVGQAALRRTVATTRQGFAIGGKSLHLYSGECEYYRVPHGQWKDSLLKIRDAHCNAICTYVPWNWHEPIEGQLDLEGRTDPQRGLIPFLDLVASLGLYVIFRPGPYICNEWLNGGIPQWLLEAHPEILALSSSGKPLPLQVMYPPITYLHPTYLEQVARWYDAVFQAVRPYLYTKGGPIICVYLDDEPSYWWGLWDPLLVDYNPFVIGLPNQPGFFQGWLEQRYQNLAELNRRYQTSYRSFTEVKPPYDYPHNHQELLQALDWYWCKLAMIDEYTAHLYTLVKEREVDVPLALLNAYLGSPMAWSKFTHFAEERKLDIVHTTESYWSMVFMTSDAREDKIGNIIALHELYKSARGEAEVPLICMEMQAGVAYHETPQQLKELYLLSIAHGINGLNFFPMTGGENPPGYGYSSGGSYDLGAPVGADGEIRATYQVIRELGQWISTHSQALLATETCLDLAVGYYEPYEAASYQGNTLECGLRDDYRDFFDHYCGYYLCQQYNAGLLTLLALSGVNFAMVDLQFAPVEQLLGYPQLWVVGLDFMERAVQEKLTAYVEQGGHLILVPRVPELDEDMRPCDLLRQLFLAAPLCPLKGTKWGRMTPSGTVSTLNGCRLAVRDYIDHFRLQDSEEAIAYDEANSLPCAYSRSYGRGQATLVGFKLAYAWDSKLNHSRFVLWLLEKDGIKRSTYSENPEVIVTERAGGERGFLFVINPTAIPQTTKIIYTDPRKGVPVSIPQVIENILLPDQGGLALVLNMPLGNLGEMVYCTSEVLTYQQVEPGEVQLMVRGPSGTWGELALRSAQKIKCSLRPPLEHSEHEDESKGVLYLTYRHPEEVVQLIISGQSDGS